MYLELGRVHSRCYVSGGGEYTDSTGLWWLTMGVAGLEGTEQQLWEASIEPTMAAHRNNAKQAQPLPPPYAIPASAHYPSQSWKQHQE